MRRFWLDVNYSAYFFLDFHYNKIYIYRKFSSAGFHLLVVNLLHLTVKLLCLQQQLFLRRKLLVICMLSFPLNCLMKFQVYVNVNVALLLMRKAMKVPFLMGDILQSCTVITDKENLSTVYP